MLETYALFGVTVLLMMIAMWLLSLRLRDSSIVDIFWGTGFVVLAWIGLLASEGTTRHVIATVLVSLWGLRLSLYLLWRNAGKPEDFRYQRWRENAGRAWWWKSFLRVFLLQGLVMWIIAIPFTAIYADDSALNIFDVLGIAIWSLGFAFEAVGDFQLARFRQTRHDDQQVLDTGLWRYTRHPNYFGDACVWWGFYLLALAAGGWWTIYAPLLMSFLLMRVSGVAMLEETLKTSKPAYEEYITRTSAFFPLPPRK